MSRFRFDPASGLMVPSREFEPRLGKRLCSLGPPVMLGEYGISGPSDPLWSIVHLYMKGEDLTDSSSFGQTITTVGSVSATTTQHIGGTKSIDFSAGNVANYLTTSFSALPTNTAADFTVECHVFFIASGTGANQAFLSNFTTATGQCFEMLTGTTAGVCAGRWKNSGGTTFSPDSGTNTVGYGAWGHFAVVRNGSITGAAMNGLWGTNVSCSGTTNNTPSSPMNIGRQPDNVWPLKGYLAHIRVTYGTGGARYTPGTTFTPPTPPYLTQ